MPCCQMAFNFELSLLFELKYEYKLSSYSVRLHYTGSEAIWIK